MQIHKRKYFQHSPKKVIFWTKLIFITKEQGFHDKLWSMSDDFKGAYQVHDV